MMTLGQDLLSEKASAIWIAALSVVLVFHCTHLVRMDGERRWYHFSHVAMLVGMLYMYASVAFGLNLLPTQYWMILYSATCLAIIIWILVRLGQRRSLSNLWFLALVQQLAMIYMWVPMRDWVPLLSYAMVVYFMLEAAGWLISAYGRLELSAAPRPTGSLAISPAPDSVFSDVCMTLMAGSMAYMFAGMQLMMSMPTQPHVAAAPQHYAPSSKPGGSDDTNKPETLTKTPETAAAEPVAAERGTSETENYTIRAGDSLRKIAARNYGSARQWHRITKANPGLDPRRLRVGQVIKLPGPFSSH
jgi:LysM repeat protein